MLLGFGNLDFLDSMDSFLVQQGENDTIVVGQSDALDKFYEKLKVKFDFDEIKDILECEDNMLIESGAGSGKTTTLLLKILRDILSGRLLDVKVIDGEEVKTQRNILVSTFLKSGAEDIKNSFNKLINEFNIKGVNQSCIRFSTIHSEVYDALRKMLGKGMDIISDEDARKYLRSACELYKVKPSMNRSSSKVLTKEELSDISSIITYARNRLDNERYNHPLMQEYNLSELEIKGIIERFNLLKRADDKADFEDLEEYLYNGYQINPNVLEYVKGRYEYIYVDEFQDTSQLQYAILKPYLESSKGFIVIGDADQCIYSFRGSDITLIQEKLEQDFDIVVKQLAVNRRCGSPILNPVIPSIELNSKRRKKKLYSKKSNGEVIVVVDGAVKYLRESIKEDLQKSQNIGIIGRTNSDLLIPALLLLIEGYNSFSVSGSISLTDRLPKQVLGAMTLLTKRYSNDFESILKLFLPKQNQYEATKLCDTLSTSPTESIYTLDLDDMRYSLPGLFPIIRMLRSAREKYEKTGDDKYLIDAYLDLLDIMETDVFNSKTIYAQRARDFVYYVKRIIEEHPFFQDKTFDEIQKLFLEQFVQELEKRRPQKNKREKIGNKWTDIKTSGPEPYIKISTVHDAKGKQWSNVYIWNDVEGCFPNTVGNRLLTLDELEEERRVHYIAWTRPTDKLVVFTRSDRDAGFLKECDLSNVTFVNNSGKPLSFGLKKAAKMNEVTKNQKKADEVVNEVTWKVAVSDYVKKYCSYQYVCSDRGNILDIALSKLGGTNALIKYLEQFQLDKYSDSDLENVISDLLESYSKSL